MRRSIIFPKTPRCWASALPANSEIGSDDLVYIAVNAHWEDVRITVPVLECPYAWYLSVNTWGDENGRFVYREGEEVRIDSEFIMHPRSVAVFTGREQP